MNVKALIVAGFFIATFAFSIAAVAAHQLEYKNVKIYLVKMTVGSTSTVNEDYKCKELRQTMNAAAAFGIMACIIAGFAAVTGLVGVFKEVGKGLKVTLISIVAVFSIISWAVAVHAFHDEFCNGPSLKFTGFTLAGGVLCMVITTILSLVSLGLTLALGGGAAAAAPASSEPAATSSA